MKERQGDKETERHRNSHALTKIVTEPDIEKRVRETERQRNRE